MGCVPAAAVNAALAEATARWPDRRKASDGRCGDERHRLRRSDHNNGNAWDLTHDPDSGCDAHAQARSIAQARDRRVKYIISNREIWSHRYGVWKWRRYYGSNHHTRHIHVSIYARYRGDTRPWFESPDDTMRRFLIGVARKERERKRALARFLDGVAARAKAKKHPTLRRGMKATAAVVRWQRFLKITPQGGFGPRTEAATKAFQKWFGLHSDGVVGPKTWAVYERLRK